MRAKVAITVADPRASFAAIRTVFPNARVVALPSGNPEPGRIILEIDAAPGVDAAVVLAQLEAKGVQGVKDVAFEED
jgi:hypothetical protein